eukprot:366458-Chlamydomonas_euryale.AAC.34
MFGPGMLRRPRPAASTHVMCTDHPASHSSAPSVRRGPNRGRVQKSWRRGYSLRSNNIALSASGVRCAGPHAGLHACRTAVLPAQERRPDQDCAGPANGPATIPSPLACARGARTS